MIRRWSIAVLFVLTAGCAGSPPFETYSIAQVALDAARRADASQYSPGNWAKADEAFNRGEIAYRDRDFGSATEYFQRATIFAEKAENISRIKKFQSGGVQ